MSILPIASLAQRSFVAISLAFVCAAAIGTTPLFDLLLYEGKSVPLHQVNGGWLQVPWSKEVEELRMNRCSAIGGPRGMYRIEDGRLWLAGLYTCSSVVSLEAAYGKSQPILAEWVTGEVVSNMGKTLCVSRSYDGYSIYEMKVTIQVNAGRVVSVSETSNTDHLELPTANAGGQNPPPCKETARN